MAKGMREIKRQIKSVQNTKQITKAMEMVAASRLKKAQQSAEAARPYADKIREVLNSITASSTGLKHPMLETRTVKRTGYLVITSDRGLAGGFNANLLRKTVTTLRERHKSTDEYAIFVVGRKGRDYFRRRNIPIVEEVTGLPDSPDFAEIKAIASKAVENYANGAYDELYLVYNVFKNALTQIPTVKRLLPFEKMEQDDKGPATAYEYEPSPEAVLEVLLPRYAETLIYSAVLESKASEFGARMTAMGSATKNATKMISSYTLVYNRARQAAITQEISEIVAGANAQV
ncbi:ATP synthase F1 subunit gamma [Gorillibacterium sp. sgz5001074]|uniref:ATP synthase F1 subunit gamma n=1 Tax=Gorillibacterium sp. sgz5001074 TaxID=3446695 RepID=UPI003F67A0AB